MALRGGMTLQICQTTNSLFVKNIEYGIAIPSAPSPAALPPLKAGA